MRALRPIIPIILIAFAALALAQNVDAAKGGKGGGGGGGGNGGGGAPPASYVAFNSQGRVYAAAEDGSGSHLLVDSLSGSSVRMLDWASDGWITVVENGDIRVVDVGDGSDPANVTDVGLIALGGLPSGGMWSQHAASAGAILPASQQLVAAGVETGPAFASNVFAYKYDGTLSQQITGWVSTFDPNGGVDTGVRYRVVDVEWLPDGPNDTIQVWYRLVRDEYVDLVRTVSELSSRVVTLDASAWPSVSVVDDQPLNATSGAFDATGVVFSRDGSLVAYEAETGEPFIWVAPVEYHPTMGTPTVRDDLRWVVADNRGTIRGGAEAPSFSPDGARLAYHAVSGNGPSAAYSVFVTDATQSADSSEIDGMKRDGAASARWGP